MRIVLVGAVESTRVALETLLRAELLPSALVTLPNEALSRHSDAVDLTDVARPAGIPVIFSSDVNSADTLAALRQVNPDLILVIGWSQICRPAFRAAARLGCVGFHPSALPRMRGRAVIPWTILTRQTEAGSTFFWLDDGIDSGDIVLQRRFPVAEDETARSLYDKQLLAISEMLPDVVGQFLSGSVNRVSQCEEDASYCARRTADDGLINWRDPADEILLLIKAVGDPYPGAFTISNGANLLVREARRFSQGERFIGMPGQVQTLTDSGFVVRCGDGSCIEVLDWRWTRGGAKPPRHSALGRH